MARVRIFMSSPGDVVDERRRAAIVINRLAREFARFLTLDAVLWEYEPMLASGHFQDAIVKPSDSDIVVLILWSRLGTPLPERYRGIDGRAPVTGTEWEFEDALAHRQTAGVPDLLVYRKDVDGIARFSRREQLDAARAQWEALENFWQRHFLTEEGGFRAAFNSFHDLDGFEAQLEQHLRQLLRQRLPAVALRGTAAGEITWTEGSPFRGLEAYEAKHAAIFFGREQAETEIIEALARTAEAGVAFLLVLGASGSGKSSLIRAGVIPTLTVPGVASGVSLWRRCLFRPGGTTGDLFDRLARALIEEALPELLEAGIDAARLAQQLRAAPSEAALPVGVGLRAAKGDGMRAGGAPRFVLLVDQLEELLTQPEITAAERAGFLAVLAALAGSGEAWVVATLRSDFYHRIDEMPGLRALAAERQYDLAPPRPAELAEIVRRPAAAAGIAYESDDGSGLGLDALIAEAAGRDPAALPLLSFALDELYRRDIAEGGGSALTLATYRAIGGLEGAIAERAEEVCRGLPEAAVAGVLRELVTQRADQEEASARPTPRAEIAATPEREAVADLLIAARLVVSAMGGAGPVLRLAHEALIRRWPRLAELIAGDRAFLTARARLLEDRDRWQREGNGADLLLPAGKRLAEGAELLATRRADLDPATAGFIEASIARDRAQTRRQLRRTEAAAAVLGVLALVAAGLGLWGWRSSVAATRERDLAQHNLALATETANGLVFDLAQKFRDAGVPAAIIADILGRARKLQDQLTTGGQISPDLRRSQAAALDETALTLLTVGDTEGALAAARQEHAIAQTLLAASPADADYQHGLSVSDGRIGDVLRVQGDLGGALSAYRDELAIVKALAQKEPGNTEWQEDLARSGEKIGDVLRAQGDLGGALAAYRDGLAIQKTLAQKEPGNTGRQRDLGVSDEEIGEVLQAEGDLKGALAAYRDSLAIRKTLAQKDPGNTEWQEDLSYSDNDIGDMLRTQGDLAGALTAYRDGLVIRKTLAQKDPGNTGWQRDLALSDDRIGEVLEAQGDLGGALTAYRDGLAIQKALAQKDPGNTGWQRDLGVSDDEIGEVLQAEGDLKGALAAYRDSLEIRKTLAQKDSGNTEWQRDLAVSDDRIGDVLQAQGNLGGALAAYRDELAIAKALAQKDPGNTLWQSDLAISDDKIGDVLQAEGDLKGALTAYRDGLAIRKTLAQKDSGNTVWQRDLSVSDERIGDVLQAQGDLGGALSAYRDELAIAKALAQKDPGNTLWQRDLSLSDDKIGSMLQAQGQFDASVAAERDSVAILRHLYAVSPTPAIKSALASALGGLSFALLFIHNPQQALESAQEALGLDPSALWIETNEAHALLFLGRFDQAKAIYLANKDKPLGDGRTFGAAVAADFALFQKYGLAPPDMQKIESLLTP